MPQEPNTETPTIAAEGQAAGEPRPLAASVGEATPATGRRQALRDLRRQLTDEELASPGVQKLLLDDLQRADSECDLLSGYVARFHDADKRAAVLEERLRTQTALEVAFGVGVGLGGAMMGLAPGLWTTPPYGTLAFTVGLLLMLGAIVARVIKR